MLRVLFCLWFFLHVVFVHAQLNNHFLIASAGDAYSSENITVAWSLGEIATETLLSDNILLTQGFQQPNFDGLSIKQSRESTNLVFQVYPNPSSGKIKITNDAENTGNENVFQLKVFDIRGEVVLSQEIKAFPYDINISSEPDGLYFIRISSQEKNHSQTFKVQKIIAY